MTQALTFKDNSVGRQEAITLSSRVVIIGGDILFFKRGRTVFFFLPVHNLLKTVVQKWQFLLWPLFILIAAVYLNFQIKWNC